MKHAYLVLAHNEFDVTQRLIWAIDDARSDIFIHVDRKVHVLPVFEVQKSTIRFVEERVDVRWGDISVVEAELNLMQMAVKYGNHAYYHLISGVDMPIKSQDYIYNFFDKHNGKEFIGFSQYNYTEEVKRKVKKYHLFPRLFRSNIFFVRFFRALFIKLQYVLKLDRNRGISFKKGTQWVSITEDFVLLLLSKREEILSLYQNTFCSDEIYKQTICWNSEFKDRIFNAKDEGLGCMRNIGWQKGELKDWENKDFDQVWNSPLIFARKFNSQNIEIVNKILFAVKT